MHINRWWPVFIKTIVTKVPLKQLFGKEWLYIFRKHELIKIVNADYSKLYKTETAWVYAIIPPIKYVNSVILSTYSIQQFSTK